MGRARNKFKKALGKYAKAYRSNRAAGQEIDRISHLKRHRIQSAQNYLANHRAECNFANPSAREFLAKQFAELIASGMLDGINNINQLYAGIALGAGALRSALIGIIDGGVPGGDNLARAIYDIFNKGIQEGHFTRKELRNIVDARNGIHLGHALFEAKQIDNGLFAERTHQAILALPSQTHVIPLARRSLQINKVQVATVINQAIRDNLIPFETTNVQFRTALITAMRNGGFPGAPGALPPAAPHNISPAVWQAAWEIAASTGIPANSLTPDNPAPAFAATAGLPQAEFDFVNAITRATFTALNVDSAAKQFHQHFGSAQSPIRQLSAQLEQLKTTPANLAAQLPGGFDAYEPKRRAIIEGLEDGVRQLEAQLQAGRVSQQLIDDLTQHFQNAENNLKAINKQQLEAEKAFNELTGRNLVLNGAAYVPPHNDYANLASRTLVAAKNLGFNDAATQAIIASAAVDAFERNPALTGQLYAAIPGMREIPRELLTVISDVAAKAAKDAYDRALAAGNAQGSPTAQEAARAASFVATQHMLQVATHSAAPANLPAGVLPDQAVRDAVFNEGHHAAALAAAVAVPINHVAAVNTPPPGSAADGINFAFTPGPPPAGLGIVPAADQAQLDALNDLTHDEYDFDSLMDSFEQAVDTHVDANSQEQQVQLDHLLTENYGTSSWRFANSGRGSNIVGNTPIPGGSTVKIDHGPGRIFTSEVHVGVPSGMPGEPTSIILIEPLSTQRSDVGSWLIAAFKSIGTGMTAREYIEKSQIEGTKQQIIQFRQANKEYIKQKLDSNKLPVFSYSGVADWTQVNGILAAFEESANIPNTPSHVPGKPPILLGLKLSPSIIQDYMDNASPAEKFAFWGRYNRINQHLEGERARLDRDHQAAARAPGLAARPAPLPAAMPPAPVPPPIPPFAPPIPPVVGGAPPAPAPAGVAPAPGPAASANAAIAPGAYAAVLTPDQQLVRAQNPALTQGAPIAGLPDDSAEAARLQLIAMRDAAERKDGPAAEQKRDPAAIAAAREEQKEKKEQQERTSKLENEFKYSPNFKTHYDTAIGLGLDHDEAVAYAATLTKLAEQKSKEQKEKENEIAQSLQALAKQALNAENQTSANPRDQASESPAAAEGAAAEEAVEPEAEPDIELSGEAPITVDKDAKIEYVDDEAHSEATSIPSVPAFDPIAADRATKKRKADDKAEASSDGPETPEQHQEAEDKEQDRKKYQREIEEARKRAQESASSPAAASASNGSAATHSQAAESEVEHPHQAPTFEAEAKEPTGPTIPVIQASPPPTSIDSIEISIDEKPSVTPEIDLNDADREPSSESSSGFVDVSLGKRQNEPIPSPAPTPMSAEQQDLSNFDDLFDEAKKVKTAPLSRTHVNGSQPSASAQVRKPPLKSSVNANVPGPTPAESRQQSASVKDQTKGFEARIQYEKKEAAKAERKSAWGEDTAAAAVSPTIVTKAGAAASEPQAAPAPASPGKSERWAVSREEANKAKEQLTDVLSDDDSKVENAVRRLGDDIDIRQANKLLSGQSRAQTVTLEGLHSPVGKSKVQNEPIATPTPIPASETKIQRDKHSVGNLFSESPVESPAPVSHAATISAPRSASDRAPAAQSSPFTEARKPIRRELQNLGDLFEKDSTAPLPESPKAAASESPLVVSAPRGEIIKPGSASPIAAAPPPSNGAPTPKEEPAQSASAPPQSRTKGPGR